MLKPLQPHERATLAVFVAAARCIDELCAYIADEIEISTLEKARAILSMHAADVRRRVVKTDEIEVYLQAVADDLERQMPGEARSVMALKDLLREMAKGVHADPHGPVMDGPYCACGILGLAHIVEVRARRKLEMHGITPEPTFQIHYSTSLSDEGAVVDGRTNTDRHPRQVMIRLRARKITAASLCHLVYTLHHELLCHGFQGALSRDRKRENINETCCWTEGWVDTAVADYVQEWLKEDDLPLLWMPLGQHESQSAIRSVHDARYGGEHEELGQKLLQFRQAARHGHSTLARTLERYHTISRAEAEKTVDRFTFLVNTHEDADLDSLRRLGKGLAITLRSQPDLRPDAFMALANACVQFVSNRDFKKLLRVVEEARSLTKFEATPA